MSDWRSVHDRGLGDPNALSFTLSPALIEQAGCARSAQALRRAQKLRDEYRQVRDELRGRDAAMAAARAADAREHARSLDGKLTPKHLTAAERRFEQLERREPALAIAVANATDEFHAALQAERETVTPDLSERLAVVIARIRETDEERASLYSEVQEIHSVLGLLADWPKRWKAPIAPRGDVSVGHVRGLTIGDLREASEALAGALEALALPGQEPEAVALPTKLGNVPVFGP